MKKQALFIALGARAHRVAGDHHGRPGRGHGEARQGVHPRRPVEHGRQGPQRLAGFPGRGPPDQRPVPAPPQGRQVDRPRRRVHQVPGPQGSVDGRVRFARMHGRGVGVRLDDGRPLRRTGAADQGGVGRPFPVQAVPLALGRPAERPAGRTRRGAGASQEEQREEQEERSAADDGRHQEAVRLVVPQHAGRGEDDVRQLRDAVPRTEGPQAGSGRVRLVPGLQRHLRRRSARRVRVEHEALHPTTCARTWACRTCRS